MSTSVNGFASIFNRNFIIFPHLLSITRFHNVHSYTHLSTLEPQSFVVPSLCSFVIPFFTISARFCLLLLYLAATRYHEVPRPYSCFTDNSKVDGAACFLEHQKVNMTISPLAFFWVVMLYVWRHSLWRQCVVQCLLKLSRLDDVIRWPIRAHR